VQGLRTKAVATTVISIAATMTITTAMTTATTMTAMTAATTTVTAVTSATLTARGLGPPAAGARRPAAPRTPAMRVVRATALTGTGACHWPGTGASGATRLATEREHVKCLQATSPGGLA